MTRGPFPPSRTHLLAYVLESAGWAIGTTKRIHYVFEHGLFRFYGDLKTIQHGLSDRAMVDFIHARTFNLHVVGACDGRAPAVDQHRFAEAYEA